MKDVLLAISMLLKPYKPKYPEPEMTLSWTAYHLFSPEFHTRYTDSTLSTSESVALLLAVIDYRFKMLNKRTKYQFELKKHDLFVIPLLKKMLDDIQK